MPLHHKNKEQSYPKNLVCLGAGDVPIKSRDQKLSWCVDPSGGLCVLITPRAAWEKVDFETSMYSEQYSIAMVMVCLGVNTENPALMPAAVPLEMGLWLRELADTISRYYALPRDVKNTIPSIFTAVELFKPENDAPVGVVLRRVGKKLEKGELYTRAPNGDKIDIYHTCLLSDEPKPYSAGEITALKSKGITRAIMKRLGR